MARVGTPPAGVDPCTYYDDVGRLTRESLLRLLPPDWSWDGKRVLDFGCGAGRTLRQFLGEAAVADVWGCDIDAASVAWLAEHLSPPLDVSRNDTTPPLDLPSDSFDLVWAVSVFTHLSVGWADWLLELRRVLRPGGLLIASFIAPAGSRDHAKVEWPPGGGMVVSRHAAPWDEGGPLVVHAPWWLRARWGRAFEVVSLEEEGFCAAGGHPGHGVVVLRAGDGELTAGDLERPDPGDPRETEGLLVSERLLLDEIASLRDDIAWLQDKLEISRADHAEALRQVGVITFSRSWRLTRLIRTVAARLRRRSGVNP
jgi:SAM-dependent methyltransferase